MCCNKSIYIDLIVEPNILVDLILTPILNLKVWRTMCFKINTNVVLMIKHATCRSGETKKLNTQYFLVSIFLCIWVRGKFCDHFRSQRNLWLQIKTTILKFHELDYIYLIYILIPYIVFLE